VTSNLTGVNMLVRREIEAGIAGPLIKGFIKAMGRKKALTIVEQVIEDLGRQGGQELARIMGGNSMAHFIKGNELWTRDGSLEMEIMEQTETTFSLNITSCRYADNYKDAGIADLGLELSCKRDFTMAEGFNPKMKLTRTQTIMEGAPYCDFCFRLE
jgi:L-2-amino-thiazoline-4-carboxylic acid hydrolase